MDAMKMKRFPEAFVEGVGRTVGIAQTLTDRVVTPDERELVGRVVTMPLHRQLRLIVRLWRDRRLGPVARAPLLAGLAYTLLPLRLVPVRLRPLQRFERAAAVGLALWLLILLAPREVVAEHVDTLRRGR